jgi:hypothetical protein
MNKMKTIYLLLVAIALMGMANAVELSNSNLALTVFHSFVEEDLVLPVEPFMPNGDAWNASQNADVADLTNSLNMGDLVRVGNMSDGKGHYLDGTKHYIQP